MKEKNLVDNKCKRKEGGMKESRKKEKSAAACWIMSLVALCSNLTPITLYS